MSQKRTLVMKFGGTSVGTTAAMGQVVNIVQETRAEWGRLVVVISALSGVTNLLLDSADRAVQGDIQALQQAAQELRERHYQIADDLISDAARRNQVKQNINHLIADFVKLCEAIAVLHEASPRTLDAVAGLGERMSVRLLAAALESVNIPSQFVEATQLIVTNDQFQAAKCDFKATTRATQQVLEPLMARGAVPIVTGFIAATPAGVQTTLGRGGSDYSAAIIGATVPADEVWIWSDVDGVMSSDPRLVSEARTIPELTYNELAELAYFGAKVLHPKTIRPVIERGIGLRVCNTFNPTNPGTRMVAGGDGTGAETAENPARVLKAVSVLQELQLITLEGRGMLEIPNVAARIFGAVAATGSTIPMITQASSEQSIYFIVPKQFTAQVITDLEMVFADELARHDIDRVWASDEVVIVTVVGEEMLHTPGVLGVVFNTLGAQGINVIGTVHGASAVCISLIAAAEDMERAVRTLHGLIVG